MSGVSATARRVFTTHATEFLLVAFIVLLLIQTPVAIIAYQYLGLTADAARALLLVKDVFAAVLLVGLFAGYIGRVQIRWFDWFAVAYVVTVLVYAAVPVLVGTDLPLIAIAASVRQFLLPVELYAVGRLAVGAGVDPYRIVKGFLLAALVAAVFTIALYVLVPVEFWQSTLDLVTFERDVQDLPRAISLWDIGVLGQYGVAESGQFARAVGPFTHPVGTANYFAVPLALAATIALARVPNILPAPLLLAAIVIFAAAVITPISRGAWISVVIAVVLIAFLYRRAVPAMAALGVAVAFVVLVPPFSYSVSSALTGTDSSVRAHQEAVEEGLGTAIENPIGLGLGQADQFGEALATEGGASGESASAGVGENLYLALFVSVGPIGLAAFVAWITGVGLALWPGFRASREAWAQVAIGAILAGFLVAALSATPLLRFTTAGTFWLLCGLAVPAVVAVRHARRDQSSAVLHTAPDA